MFKKKKQKQNDAWEFEEFSNSAASGNQSWNQSGMESDDPFSTTWNEVPQKKSAKKSNRNIGPVAAILVVAIIACVVFVLTRHKHVWTEATCTAPRICGDCGETEGYALGHVWEEATLNRPKMCTRCQKIDGDTLADGIFEEAERYMVDGNYRLAIQILDKAYEEYGEPMFRETASAYRTAFGNYHASRVAAGKRNSILIYPDGTISIVGETKFKELDATDWQDIATISAGDEFVVGLRKDGTVVGAGRNKYKEYGDVEYWENVIAISAGDFHTVGLLSDGTIVSAPGYNHCGQAEVASLNQGAGNLRIVAVSAGYDHTLALLEDGTVVACGDWPTRENTQNGVCQVSHWRDIAAICSGTEFCAGLRTDGTVVVAGVDWDLSDWTDVYSLSAGDFFLVGLKADGTVLYVVEESEYDSERRWAMEQVRDWTDIVFIAAGHDHIVGIRADGRVLCAGLNTDGQCALQGVNVALSD